MQTTHQVKEGGQPGEPLEWDTATSQEWLSEVESWPWEPLPDKRYVKRGRCPRCGHMMDFVLEEADVAYMTERKAGGEVEFVTILCNCSSPHTGRPEDAGGCGCGGRGFTPPPDLSRAVP